MSAQKFEAFLARLYVDEGRRASFKQDPRGEAERAGLSEEEVRALENIDWDGLELAARSFAKKRDRKRLPSWSRWWRRILRIGRGRF